MAHQRGHASQYCPDFSLKFILLRTNGFIKTNRERIVDRAVTLFHASDSHHEIAGQCCGPFPTKFLSDRKKRTAQTDERMDLALETSQEHLVFDVESFSVRC